MLTGSQAADVLGLVQTRVAAALADDDWLGEGGTGGIATITTRALPAESLSYRGDELPSLVVAAEGLSAEHESGTFGAYDQTVRVSVDYVTRSADVADGMDDARTALARLARWLRTEAHTAGKRLDGLLEDADGRVRASDGQVRPASGSNYVVRGEFRFELVLRVEF